MANRNYVSRIVILMGLMVAASKAAVSVDFTGGGGSSLQITLPSITFVVNNANALNFDSGFGIGIALGQTPASVFYNNASAAGTSALFNSSNSSTTFSGAPGYRFYSNSVSSDANSGGLIWYGESFSENAVNGDVITFNGGTLSTSKAIAEAFADGNYEIYLIAGASGAVSSTAGVAAVPEPSLGILAGAGLLGCLLRRSRSRA